MATAIRWIVAATVLLTGCGGFVAVGPPPANAPRTTSGYEIDVGQFYDRVAQHGDWVHHGRYGWVWIPNEGPIGWRPYTRGHWIHTFDDGSPRALLHTGVST